MNCLYICFNLKSKKNQVDINNLLKDMKMLNTSISSIYTLDLFSNVDSPKYQEILENCVSSIQPD